MLDVDEEEVSDSLPLTSGSVPLDINAAFCCLMSVEEWRTPEQDVLVDSTSRAPANGLEKRCAILGD